MRTETDDDTREGDVAEETSPFPPSELTLLLRKPVNDADGSKIAHLALREPTDDEWVQIMKQDRHVQRRHAVSLVSALPLSLCAQMAISDLVRAENYLFAFFEVAETVRDW